LAEEPVVGFADEPDVGLAEEPVVGFADEPDVGLAEEPGPDRDADHTPPAD
jgi:hypothetical protein